MKHEKIAPGLLIALGDFSRSGPAGLRRNARAMGLFASAARPEPRASVFLRCDPKADLKHLAAYQVQVNQSQGEVRTAIAPLKSLDPVSDDPAVRRIVPSRYLRPRLDIAGLAVKVAALRSKSLDGADVLIGTIDTGIDSAHPAFGSRVNRIWDQNVANGPGAGGFAYGQEFTGPALVASRDVNGHGTHVAGIAAGDDPRYGGMAPKATVITVATDFLTTHLADAVQYIFSAAASLKMPAVINMSLGGHGDPHDGSDELSQIIDQQSGPGRIVCCAAGNEGADPIHAAVTVMPNSSQNVTFFVTGPAALGQDAIFINAWYPGAGSGLDVAVQSPSGSQTAFQQVISTGNNQQSYNLPQGIVSVATPGPNPVNGDYNIFISVDANGTVPLGAGTWTITLRNSGSSPVPVDLWVQDSVNGFNTGFTGAAVANSLKIGAPGACASAVTVASYTTRTNWVDVAGNPWTVGFPLNDLSPFSSNGPLRARGGVTNAVLKPDVTAPGAMIVSCRSSARPAPVPPAVDQYIIDPQHLIDAGTSMATPVVTGIVALLLQRNPGLDPPAVKALLQRNCRIPGSAVGNVRDDRWGYGLIDSTNM